MEMSDQDINREYARARAYDRMTAAEERLAEVQAYGGNLERAYSAYESAAEASYFMQI